MNTIKFWGGLETIGSNIFSIENENNRIIMDFGLRDGYKKHMDVAALTTYNLLKNNRIPKIPFIYDTKDIRDLDIPSIEDSPYQSQAIFISHAHDDHIEGLKYISSDVDVYFNEETFTLLDNMNWLKNCQGTAIKISNGSEINLGNYKIQFLENDHDVIGTAAILIKTAEGNLLHSGDIRMNGYYPEKMRVLTDKVKNKINWLFLETTSFSFDYEKNNNEIDMLNVFKKYTKTEQAIVINPYSRNIDRLRKLNEIGLDSKRPVLWNEQFGRLLAHYTDRDIHVWSEDVTLEMDSSQFVVVSFAEYLNEPYKYMIQLAQEDNELLEQIPSGKYLHMNGMPFGDYVSGYDELMTQIEKAKWEYIDLTVFAHAMQDELLAFVEEIDPELVVAWHSYRPEKFADAMENNIPVLLPELDKAYDFGGQANG